MGSRARQCEPLLKSLCTTRLYTKPQDVLREFCRSQQNLMFDSLYPELAPHIVVTTVEETWNDGFIQWQNCVNFQRPEYLTVPHYPALLDCCPTDAGHLKYATEANNSETSADMMSCGSRPVFSLPVFNKHVCVHYKPCRVVSRTFCFRSTMLLLNVSSCIGL